MAEVAPCYELLIRQHRDAERLLAELAAVLEDSARAHEAAFLFSQLETELDQHYALEEQGFFAVLSQYRSMMLMEFEHDDLLHMQHAVKDLLAQSLQTVKTGQESGGVVFDAELRQAFQAWQTRLLAHMFEEEDKIFPLAQRFLEPEERQKVHRLFDQLMTEPPRLFRPDATYRLMAEPLTFVADRPVAYRTLYERDHNAVQQVFLQAGRKLARHWAGQDQFLIVLAGELRLITDTDTDAGTDILATGAQVAIDSRCWFALEAVTDSSYLLFKTWPHPHYTKA